MIRPPTDEEKRLLLVAARNAVEVALGVAAAVPPPDRPPPWLALTAGVFVTITEGGELRGCVGRIVADRPVYETVREMAVSSALSDRRFSPVTPAEAPRLRFEISVLTPPVPVADWREIEIPRHGMILSKYGRRALFLPQVAGERGWDVETTLTQLAVKAGLAPDDWREGADYEVFEAMVFAERR